MNHSIFFIVQQIDKYYYQLLLLSTAYTTAYYFLSLGNTMRCVRQRMLSILNIFCLCVCLFHDHDLVRGLDVVLTDSPVSSLISRFFTLSLRHSPMTGSCFVITLLMIIFPDWRMVGRSSIDQTQTWFLRIPLQPDKPS